VTEGFDFLIGEPVNQVWVWGPVRLVIESERIAASVDLQRATFTDPSGQVKEINAEERPSDAGPLLDLLWKKVTLAESADGVLVLRFDDGSEVRAYPSERYESWSVVGDGRTFQCLPGGEVASS
jgi:hypothetical protein